MNVGAPVVVGGITIYQGDLLHGDRNGVTTIPHEIAGQVADGCKELMTAEDIILKYVKGSKITTAGFEEARRASSAAIESLGEEARGEMMRVRRVASRKPCRCLVLVGKIDAEQRVFVS